MKKIYVFLAMVFAVSCACSQAFTGIYNFANVTTSSGLTDPTPVPVAPGVNFGSFSAVGQTQINPNAAGRFSFTAWPTGATNGSNVFNGSILTTQFYEITITPATGYNLDINSITFTLQRSGTGIRQYSVRSGIDGYANDLPASIDPANADLSVVGSNVFQVNDAASGAETGSTITLDASFDIISSAVTFRFYAWNAEGAGGSFSIDDVAINGIASSGVSLPGRSTIVAGPASPATLSSLINTPASASANFSFIVNEDGATDDNNPTLVTGIILIQGSNNNAALDNWTQAIAGAELSDGSSTATGAVNAGNITFASLPNASPGDIGHIADNGSKTYSLKIWLKTALDGTLPVTVDSKQFEFLVQTSGVSTAGSGSSGIAAGQSVSSGASTNVVTVIATKLAYAQNTTSPTGLNVAMTPAVIVSANDANDNRDLDFISGIQITSTGTLNGSPVTTTASAGIATFSALTHTAAGTGLTLNAERSGTLDWDIVSNVFEISAAPAAAYYFRSAGNGDWNSTSTWESASDNSNWIAATVVPNENANTITIRSGHTITLSTAITADQVVIGNTAILNNSAGMFTINDGVGDDIVIQNGGVFTLASSGGPAFGSGSPTVNVNGGGILRIARSSYTGNGTGANSTNYIYQHASVLEYTLTSGFSASGVTYFPNADAATVPIFRITSTINTAVGGAGNTVINGIFEANGNITFQSAGTKTFRNGIRGTGNITQSTTSGVFIINGTTAQLGGTGSITMNAVGLELGTATLVTLESNKDLIGNLSLNNGNLLLGDNNFSITGNITGGSPASYVKTNGTGVLTINNIGVAPKIFPVGNAKYNPLIIENGSNHNWSVRIMDGITADAGFNSNKAVLVTWDVTPSANPPAGGADITFRFDEATQVGPSFSAATNVQTWHRPVNAWIRSGIPAIVNTTVPNAATVKVTGLTGFSPNGLSNIDGPLPVYFADVKATPIPGGVKVVWSNMTELEVIRYSVERSADGRNFVSTGEINARLNNGGKADYSFVDATPLNGINFYRIKSLEATGKTQYSIIVKVDLRGGAAQLVLYPNPASGGHVSCHVNNLAKGQFTVRVFNSTGLQVYSKVLSHPGGSVSEVIVMPSAKRGLYCLQLIGSDKTLTMKFVIQ